MVCFETFFRKNKYTGFLYGIGKNTDNALGIGTWEGNNDNLHWRYDSLQIITLPNNQKAAGIDACLGTSLVWTSDGIFLKRSFIVLYFR